MHPAVGHIKSVKYSVDVADLVDGNGSFAALSSDRHAETFEGVRHRTLSSSTEPIVQSRCNGGNEDQYADDDDIVNVDQDSDTICFAEIATEEETGSCN